MSLPNSGRASGRKTKVKKVKKIRLDSKPKIKRRLFKKWSEKVRERDGHACIMCGAKPGTPECKKIDAHHYLQRSIKDSPLKFDLRDGGSLCPSCHKFNGERSAHKSPIVFYEWLAKNRPEHYKFVLEHAGVRVDLGNRDILAEIEARLDANKELDIDKLIRMNGGAKTQNENNVIGQPIPNLPGEQKDHADVLVHGPDITGDQTCVPGVERREPAADAFTLF